MNSMETAAVATEQEAHSLPGVIHRDPGSARQEISAWEALHRAERHERQERYSHFYSAGRMLLGALFLLMAYTKLVHFNGAVETVAAAGNTDSTFLVGIGLIVELIGGLMLALGWQVRVAAGGLIGYLVTVTILLNWNQSIAANRAFALANLGCIAALLLLAAHGAGAASLEKTLARRRAHAGRS